MKTEEKEIIASAAKALREADESKVAIKPLRETYPALDVEMAYRIQAENNRLALGSKGRVIGRKIGLTSKSVQKQLGVDQPDFGTLRDDMCFGDAQEIPWSRLMQPKAEAEIAMVIGRDLTEPGVSFAEATRAVEFALPALEIVGSRIENWNIKLVDTVSDNASSSVFVLGDSPKKLSKLDLRMCGMVMERKGEPVSLGAGLACLGHPINAVAWLANTMIRVGEPLRAGDIVMTGALGPMVAVAPGDAIEARINGLGSVRALFGERS